MFNFILDILFPIYCISCSAPRTPLCNNCISSISPSEDTPSKNIQALFSYRDKTMRKAIWSLKYRNNTPMARVFAQLFNDFLLEKIAEEKQFSSEDIILIPIPISRKRFKKRGYNQVELIIKDMSFICLFDVLYKSHDTLPQMEIKNRSERLKNVRESFGIKNPHLVKGKNIIVVDDIITTGATMREAMKVLKKAGAKKVSGLALAH